MTDIRALPIEERRQIAAEAERRARAGESPVAISAALGIAPSTYYRWAALFGFRLGDLQPGHKLARTGGYRKDVPHDLTGLEVLPGAEALARQPGEAGSVRSAPAPAGAFSAEIDPPDQFPGATKNQAQGCDTQTPTESRYPSGRFMLGQGLGGRMPGSGRPPGIDLDAEGLTTVKQIFYAVREAEQAGDEARVERLLAAWKLKARRARDYEKLEKAAYKEMSWEEQCDLETGHLTDEELAEEVSRLVGHKVYVRKS